ncbi:polysaccharide pyruvyl transferase family protein [Phenylobacterium sp. LjRoot225]|uniref:polysaccharide pyruvyl transferase family protein n=1 Tax=Phenylobacterium sp. LjRoot225 TaxID=3342285 RepID=UPI003ECCCFE2
MAATQLRGELSAKIEAILNPLLAGRNEHICIIDPPGHPNVGDCAILLGELDFFAQHHSGSRLSYFDVDTYTADADKYIDQASILVIHGGGNFGDIWPHHHRMRSMALERFRHKPIIQMPQSISFDSDEELKRTADLIKAHSDFTLLVRDTRSQAFAEQHFECRVILCPDMAFAMRPIKRKAPSTDIFCLLRTDKEAVADHAAIEQALRGAGARIEVGDWLENPPTLTSQLDYRLKRMARFHPERMAPFGKQFVWARQAYARSRLNYGVELLSRGRIVVTDRLHAHVLSSLLDIPNYAFDSYDGKISALYETWTKGRAEATLVASPAELAEILQSRLKAA